jgi:hypothetical protein
MHNVVYTEILDIISSQCDQYLRYFSCVLYLNQDTANNFPCLKLNAPIVLFCGWLIDLYLNVHEIYGYILSLA